MPLKAKADAVLLEQRVRRINKRDGEPFGVDIGRAYDEVPKVLGTRPNDGQLTRVIVQGRTFPPLERSNATGTMPQLCGSCKT